ncbi:glycosyltransferase family 4 protein [Streptomyces roseicoloratus]|uniref:D-inositol 3-phosphate glycosyltransferase n=1 Tax=Streptomyces roseicoloratus TaxID=2508722 RepID=A0ABY9S1R9_9ACTN|nr:glycosyltransferase family 4 protein [Streptomyces roseicoloratus]WMX48369.1 glycosyltransferase family 4 protein [Streptomyces roseicoloratus]
MPDRGRRSGPLLVAVSGPDGGATGSLVRALAGLLRQRGFAVATVQGHGCVMCRMSPVPPRVRDEGEPDGPAWRDTCPERRGSWSRRAHPYVDLGELKLRVVAARLLVRAVAGGRVRVVLTDRGPLDGLVDFGLPPGHGAARRIAATAGRYDLTLLPEAPQDRGGEPAAGSSAAGRAGYDRWAGLLPRTVRVTRPAAPATLADAALEQVLRRVRLTARDPDSRKRVVLSVYDDGDHSDRGGGGALVVDRLARRLAEHYEVTVVTAGRDARGGFRQGVRYVRLPVRRAGRRLGQLAFRSLLPFVARRIPHDAWLESFTPPFATSFLPLLSRAPVVGIDQDRGAEAMWRRYHLPFFLVERLRLRCYRYIVVADEADGSAVRRLSPHADVQVIAGGVEPRQLDDARLGSGDFILFLGRMDTWTTGLDLLLDAYETARPPMELVLAGSGTPAEERRLEQLLAGRELTVRVLDRVDEDLRQRLLRDSAFLVLPSRHEAFGLVALESMAYGKPVLHFDLPALRWMRDGGDVAVPPFDTAAFGERMRALATDPALRGRLGRQAGLAARRYTWDEVTDRYLALTRRLVESPHGSHRPRKDRRARWQTIP